MLPCTILDVLTFCIPGVSARYIRRNKVLRDKMPAKNPNRKEFGAFRFFLVHRDEIAAAMNRPINIGPKLSKIAITKTH
jgi:hypothetical protein